MPPRSVCLNVYTTARGLGKQTELQQTIAEIDVGRDGDDGLEGVRLGSKDVNEAQSLAAQAMLQVPACAVCKSTSDVTETPLLRCSRCRLVFYCNTACQKADWKTHKKNCGPRRKGSDSTPSTSPATPSGPSPSEFLSPASSLGFVVDDRNLDLHSLDQQTVFMYLIDAYRLRVVDDFKLPGLSQPLPSSETRGSITDFETFLNRAEQITGLLPQWWDEMQKVACEDLAQRDHWHNIQSNLEANAIAERYSDPQILSRLRLLADKIYGTTTATAHYY